MGIYGLGRNIVLLTINSYPATQDIWLFDGLSLPVGGGGQQGPLVPPTLA